MINYTDVGLGMGNPPIITVNKNGLTCKAGAGSIYHKSGSGWHGFLRNGVFVLA